MFVSIWTLCYFLLASRARRAPSAICGKPSYNLQLSISHVPPVTRTSGDDEDTPIQSTTSSDVVLESLCIRGYQVLTLQQQTTGSSSTGAFPDKRREYVGQYFELISAYIYLIFVIKWPTTCRRVRVSCPGLIGVCVQISTQGAWNSIRSGR